MIIRFIGDAHGKFDAYYKTIGEVDYSIQIGDFGFYECWYRLSRRKIDATKHKILPGNHDEYPAIDKNYSLGDYGVYSIGEFSTFFVRGAWSIDQAWRAEGISWWAEEELGYKELFDALDIYSQIKPDIMITHECPGGIYGVSKRMFRKKWMSNRTSLFLQEMFKIHQPKLWIFGHWHETKYDNINGTEFVCLGELDYVDYEIDENIGNDINWNIVKIREQINNLKKELYDNR